MPQQFVSVQLDQGLSDEANNEFGTRPDRTRSGSSSGTPFCSVSLHSEESCSHALGREVVDGSNGFYRPLGEESDQSDFTQLRTNYRTTPCNFSLDDVAPKPHNEEIGMLTPVSGFCSAHSEHLTAFGALAK